MNAGVRSFFAAAAAAYQQGNPLLTVEREETPGLLPELAGRDLLDLGSGPGHYARLARARGARMAVALDLTLEMAREASRPVIVADAVELPFREESFDVVVAALLLSFVADLRTALREGARVLRPEGSFVISDLHPFAITQGWRRSFQGPRGQWLAIEAPPPTAAEIETAADEAGLSIEERREALIDQRLERAFRRAGRSDFPSLRGLPLLQLYRATKTANGGPHAR